MTNECFIIHRSYSILQFFTYNLAIFIDKINYFFADFQNSMYTVPQLYTGLLFVIPPTTIVSYHHDNSLNNG